MKKIFVQKTFYIVSFLLGCTACKQEYTELIKEAEPILFDIPTLTVEETGTRSELKNTLSAGDEFGVLGYCVPYTVGTITPNYGSATSSWTIKKAQCPPDVFYKQKVVVGVNGCTYDFEGGSGNNPKYWYSVGYDTEHIANNAIQEDIENYKYSFFAYYPYEDKNQNYQNGEQPFTIDQPVQDEKGVLKAGAPILTFTMPQNGSSDDVDSNLLDHNKTPDAMLSILYDRIKDNGNLCFNFSHVLTAFGVEVNNFSDYDLTIHSLKLKGHFYKKILIDLTGSSVSWSVPSDRYSGYYPILEKDLNLLAPVAANGKTVTQSESPIGGEYIMLISGTSPQFGENVEMDISYTFNGECKTDVLSLPGTFVPQPGVKYTTQLNFVGDAFVLQFVVDNSEQWQDGSDSDITFE